jgi:nucleoside-diphosphate-sugar epimerase
MRALVTGASGFIGRHLIDALSRRDHAVRAALRSDRSGSVRSESIVVGEIDGTTDWRPALEGIDTVFHLAAHVHADPAPAADEHMRTVNVLGTLRLAQAAASSGVRRFIFLSTAKVMGERSGTRPFVETDPPAPNDAYARSKWDAEQQLPSTLGSVQRVVVRPPLVYGPGVGANFLRLLRAAATPWPLPLGSANARRSLIFVDNLVDALVACATHAAAAGKTFFVTDGIDLTVAQLLSRLRELRGQPARLLPMPRALLAAVAAATGEQRDLTRLFEPLQIDASCIHRTLGWRPPHSIESGLRATIAWFDAHHSSKR